MFSSRPGGRSTPPDPARPVIENGNFSAGLTHWTVDRWRLHRTMFGTVPGARALEENPAVLGQVLSCIPGRRYRVEVQTFSGNEIVGRASRNGLVVQVDDSVVLSGQDLATPLRKCPGCAANLRPLR